MTEIILLIIILALLGYHAWYVSEHDKQTNMFTRALLSKDINDFTSSEIATKTPKMKVKEEDLVPFDELSDKQFEKIIKQQAK